jgi:hypothetical protein
VAVFVQVQLIGAYVFGAETGALDAHKSVGFTAPGLELLAFVSALLACLPRPDLGRAVAPARSDRSVKGTRRRWLIAFWGGEEDAPSPAQSAGEAERGRAPRTASCV